MEKYVKVLTHNLLKASWIKYLVSQCVYIPTCLPVQLVIQSETKIT